MYRGAAPPVLALLASCIPFPVTAQAPVAALAPEIVVTASRAAEPLDQALAAVTAITRDDIERLQVLDLQDLFVGLPGITFASNGGPGKSSSLYVRGSEPDHVLVLIDGIKLGSATSGSTPFEQIPVDLIERIEIVRGPRSSLYGSEAIGGVIQIFTRRGAEGRKAVPSFAAGRGTRGDSRLEAGVRGEVGAAWYSAGLSGRHTDGINVRPNQHQADKDGFESRAGSLRLGYRIGEDAEIAATYLEAQGDNDYDAASQDRSETQNQVFGATARFKPLSRWTVNLGAGRSRDESDNFLGNSFVGNFDTRRDYGSLINQIALGDRHTLALGADQQDDRIVSTTAYARTRRHNTAVFGQYRGQVGEHEFQASLRSDDNQQFGRRDTGGAAYAYHVLPQLRLGVSYGTAFKAPTFNELYFPGFGNPDAEPEKSKSLELGLNGASGALSYALNAFQTRIEDLIAFDSDIGMANNVDQARIRGVEGQVGARLGALRLQGALTWLQPENDSGGANHGNTLPRRRERSGRLDLDYDWRRLSLGFTVYGASKTYDNPANTTVLDGYGLLHLRAALRVMPQWQLQLEGRNVLDKTYETAASYANHGASFMATVRYTPSS